MVTARRYPAAGKIRTSPFTGTNEAIDDLPGTTRELAAAAPYSRTGVWRHPYGGLSMWS